MRRPKIEAKRSALLDRIIIIAKFDPASSLNNAPTKITMTAMLVTMLMIAAGTRLEVAREKIWMTMMTMSSRPQEDL